MVYKNGYSLLTFMPKCRIMSVNKSTIQKSNQKATKNRKDHLRIKMNMNYKKLKFALTIFYNYLQC